VTMMVAGQVMQIIYDSLGVDEDTDRSSSNGGASQTR
jgi:hypothetical protein